MRVEASFPKKPMRILLACFFSLLVITMVAILLFGRHLLLYYTDLHRIRPVEVSPQIDVSKWMETDSTLSPLGQFNAAKRSDELLSEDIDFLEDGTHYLHVIICVSTHLCSSDGKPSIKGKAIFGLRRELVFTLQLLLDHPYVATVHLFSCTKASLRSFRKLSLRNDARLVLHLTHSVNLRSMLTYAHEHLSNRIVMLAEQTIYLGEGWQLINRTMFRLQNEAFALSSYQRKESKCGTSDGCKESSSFLGAHHSFTFIPSANISRKYIETLDIADNNFNSENKLTKLFRDVLKYKLTNPCLELKTFRFRCINEINLGDLKNSQRGIVKPSYLALQMRVS